MTAIEYRRYELRCDSPLAHADPETAVYRAPAQKTRVVPRALTRLLAAEAGWTHVRSPRGINYGQDFCPDHKPVKEGRP